MEELLASPHMMETAAIVLAATAATAWINAKVLKLPVAVGMLVLGLIFSLIAYTVDYLHPELGEAKLITTFLKDINYPTLVLEFLLAYLLFAGALNVNLGALGRRSVAVLVLAVAGTIITAVLMAAGFWGVAQLIGIDLPPAWALVFGVLISPTDPIAVLAMTKRTSLEPHLQAQIEGEALFNDGVAVVLFGAALAYAMATTGAPADVGAEASGQAVSVTGLTLGVLKQALGGAALGLGIGVLGVLVNRTVDDWATETLVTVAVATGAYFAAMHLGLSGPIGVVVAGLVGASNWADRGHSEKTKHYLHPFWHVIDEALNAVLFLLAGFIFFQFTQVWEPRLAIAGIAAPVLMLAARWISIAIPSAALPLVGRKPSIKLINVLTWAGVRGGLSLAMAFALPESPYKPVILAGAFGVVIFSMVVQSMTMEKLAISTGYGEPKADPEPTH